MQEAMIVTNDRDSLDRLNRRLKDNYRVIMSCPMPSSCATSICGTIEFCPTCLVIVEKKV